MASRKKLVKRKKTLGKSTRRRSNRTSLNTVLGRKNPLPVSKGLYLDPVDMEAFATAYANAYMMLDAELLNTLNERLAEFENKEDVYRHIWNKISNRDAATQPVLPGPPNVIYSNGPLPTFVGQQSVPGEFTLEY